MGEEVVVGLYYDYLLGIGQHHQLQPIGHKSHILDLLFSGLACLVGSVGHQQNPLHFERFHAHFVPLAYIFHLYFVDLVVGDQKNHVTKLRFNSFDHFFPLATKLSLTIQIQYIQYFNYIFFIIFSFI